MNYSTEQNVAQDELNKFNALAAHWWDANGDFKTLHRINPVRADYIDMHSPVRERSVLDIGCGGGLLSEELARRGAVVTGLDAAEHAITVAQLHLHESQLSVQYIHTTAEVHAESHAHQYDIVCCMELLEHVPDPASLICACARLATSGGILYFSTLNRNLQSWLYAIVGAEYLLRLLPQGTHQYEKFIKPSEIAQWLRENHCSVRDISGVEYNPLTHHCTLSQNCAVNYMVRAQAPE